jgi:hypothetical protein
MEISKLKLKQLTMVDLADLFFKSEDAGKYAERFQAKIESFGYCQKWAKKIDNCVKSILIVQQEMRELLEKEGAFKAIGE